MLARAVLPYVVAVGLLGLAAYTRGLAPGGALFACKPPTQAPKFRYVSVNSKGDLVVRYPANLGLPGDAENHVRITALSVKMPWHVRPLVGVSVRIEAASPRAFRYEYSVGNSSHAVQAITSWLMVLPIAASILAAATPGWTRASVVPGPADPRAAAYFAPPAFLLGWSDIRPERPRGLPVLRGDTLPGFVLTSPAAPGFVRNYFQSEGPVDPTRDMPNEVAQEVEYYMKVRHYAVKRIFLGPAFPPDEPPASIAASLLKSVARLACRGKLDQGSAFVREAVGLLRGIAGGGPAAELGSRPTTPMEAQLETAIRLNNLARPRRKGD